MQPYEIPTSRTTFTRVRNQGREAQFGLFAASAQTRAAPACSTAAAARGSMSKSRTNSSSGTPSESQSKSCWTGSRVPRKQGAPLIRAGSTQTACSSAMGWSGFDVAKVFISRNPVEGRFHLRGMVRACGGEASALKRGVVRRFESSPVAVLFREQPSAPDRVRSLPLRMPALRLSPARWSRAAVQVR